MNDNKGLYGLLAAIALCAFAVGTFAQDTSQTKTTQGAPSQEVQVEKGEVVYVSGNELVVKMEDGQLRHITVPEGATATVDGKTITIKDVAPGMKLQRAITTTTTPETVTTVRTIKGKVWHVQAPSTIILTLPDNTQKRYKVPQDQVFTINGEKKTIWDVRQGMEISATVLTEVPQTSVTQERQVSGSMPEPPPTPPMEGVLLVETGTPVPATVAEAVPPKLPQTGSVVPLIGLLGLLALSASATLRLFRKQ